MKTAELTGIALDWAVCKANGQALWAVDEYTEVWMANRRYSADWAKGGPIIERESVAIRKSFDDERDEWTASIWADTTVFESGPTPLIAAMRCYVASKLGDNVNIPDELYPQ